MPDADIHNDTAVGSTDVLNEEDTEEFEEFNDADDFEDDPDLEAELEEDERLGSDSDPAN